MDVWAVGVDTPLIENLAYGDVSDYLELPEGDYTLELRVAPSQAGDAAAYSQVLSVPADATITATAFGSLTSTATDNSFRIGAFVEDWDVVAMDTARVRVVHGSPDAGTVAIDVGNDGTPELPQVPLFAESGSAGVELPAGESIAIGVWATDMDGNPTEPVTAFTTPELPDGAELFVIATGFASKLAREDGGLSLLAIAPDGPVGFIRQDPVVYALHAGPDAPSVDIFAGGSELVDDLAFGDISQPLQVPPGSYALDFFGHAVGDTRPGDSPAASATTPPLEAGQQYLAIAAGFLDDSNGEGVGLIPLAEGFSLGSADGLLRVVHASGDAPAVDIGPVAGGIVTPLAPLTGVPFGVDSGADGIALPAATYELGVSANSDVDSNALFAFPGIDLMGGERWFVVSAGSVAGVNDNGFRLLAVDTGASPWDVIEVAPVD